MTTVDLLTHNAEVDGAITDLAITAGRVVGMAPALRRSVTPRETVDAHRRALIPGLHDHHVHLLAMAAAEASLDLEVAGVTTPASFASTVRDAAAAAPPHTVVRVIGYHESIAGPLDRWTLDALDAARPLRIQHRSGAAWVLDSRSLDRLPSALPAGAERDEHGRPTGRFLREDRWLREHLGTGAVTDLRAVGAFLASRGVTGVTDMTPFDRTADLDLLATARRSGALPQHVVATGGPSLTRSPFPAEIGVGPVKLVVDEFDIPDLDDLVSWITTAHDAGRPVAIHCIGRVVLALVVAALDDAGSRSGDRVEHGSVVPPEYHQALRALGCTVVTQPGFVRRRGDRYLADVDADDLAHLWPCGSLLDAGIAVACSTDAPYGPADPWQVIAAAAERTTTSGKVLGAHERITTARALALFSSPLDDPGGSPRTIAVGEPADLVLLDRPLADALRGAGDVTVSATWIDGTLVHEEVSNGTIRRSSLPIGQPSRMLGT